MKRTEGPGALCVATGQYMREVREKAGLSQVDVSVLLGVNNTSISFYETGRFRFPMEVFVRWCEVLHLDPGETLTQVLKEQKALVARSKARPKRKDASLLRSPARA